LLALAQEIIGRRRARRRALDRPGSFAARLENPRAAGELLFPQVGEGTRSLGYTYVQPGGLMKS